MWRPDTSSVEGAQDQQHVILQKTDVKYDRETDREVCISLPFSRDASENGV